MFDILDNCIVHNHSHIPFVRAENPEECQFVLLRFSIGQRSDVSPVFS